MKYAAIVSILLGIAASVSAQNLQFINESAEALEVFHLKPDAERESKGSVAPGKQMTIPTTLGHRFLLVDGNGVTKAEVTSEVPVQGFRLAMGRTFREVVFTQNFARMGRPGLRE